MWLRQCCRTPFLVTAWWRGVGSGGPSRTRQAHPPPPAKVPELLPCPPRASIHSHVENRLLVSVLTAVPDRQGVVTPLQVKLLEGQLDHLGREQGLGRGQGLPGDTPTALKTARIFTSPCPERPRHHLTQPSIQTECFHATFSSVSFFSLGPYSLWGPLTFSKDDHGTSGQFWRLSWQHQAHLASCERIRLFLHALMHRNPRGTGGRFSGHMGTLRYAVLRDLQTLPSASPLPAFLHPLCLFICRINECSRKGLSTRFFYLVFALPAANIH